MKTRIISSIVIIGPMLVFVFLGGIPLLLFCLALSAIGMWEFYKGYAAEGVKAGKAWAFALLAALYFLIGIGEFSDDLAPSTYTHLIQMWLFGAVFLGLVMTLIRKDHNILNGSVTTIGLLYIGYFFAHIVFISGIDHNYHLMVWIVFIAAFGQDTFAYFTGYFFGKHKMAPNISPKKTIEGAIGGVIGATVLCGVFGIIFFRDDDFIHCLIMGFFGAFFGMAGDLIASAFKRKMGIKDYGNLIPGHGGILDRFDSVLLVAPFVYYYILLFVRP